MTSYIAYYRVSTDKQGRSGLGLEAQQEAVAPYRDQITHSFTEIESGSDNHRPQLAAAIAMCKSTGATLLIAKIDRLSRDAGFLLTLRSSGLAIMAADMPHVGTLEFGIRAVFAQHEREEISRRTKAALAAAKARGQKLGSPNPRAGGVSQQPQALPPGTLPRSHVCWQPKPRREEMDDYRIVVDRRRRLFAKPSKLQMAMEGLAFFGLLALIFVVLSMLAV
jgi:DNA invertase Pin-like site-specific DNA recombinase